MATAEIGTMDARADFETEAGIMRTADMGTAETAAPSDADVCDAAALAGALTGPAGLCVSVKRTDVKRALSALRPCVMRGKIAQPLFKCVHVRGVAGGIELTATDLERGLTLGVDARTDFDGGRADGSVLIDFAQLYGAVKDGPDRIILEANDLAGTLDVGPRRILCEDPRDWPAMPACEGPEFKTLTFDAGLLREGLLAVSFAAAEEKGRYALNGVLLASKGAGVDFCAADGARLALYRARDAQAGADADCILPGRGVAVLTSVLAKRTGPVAVAVGGACVHVAGAGFRFWTLPVEGMFPRYMEVIPTGQQLRARFGRDALLQAMEAGRAVCTSKAYVLDLAVDADAAGGTVELTGGSPEKGTFRAVLTDGGHAEALSTFRVSWNPDFLVDWLQTLPAGCTVDMYGKSGRAPLKFWTESAPCVEYVVSPIIREESDY